MSLRESIENEAIPLFKYLNNKAKIAFLSANNVVQGKIKQKAEAPVIEEIFSDPIINGETQNSQANFGMGPDDNSVMGEGEGEIALLQKFSDGIQINKIVYKVKWQNNKNCF